MKKFLPFLISVLSISTLIGCSKKKEEVAPKIEVVADFENWAPDFQTMKISYGFGKVTRNEEQKFVHGGKYSALVQPLGDKTYRFKPTFYFPLRSATFEFNKSNLRKYTSLCCSVYNDNNFEIPVTIGFLSEISTYYNNRRADGETFNLKPNEWTEIEYKIDLDFLSMFFNVEEAPALYFEFEKQEFYDVSFAPKIYFDDIYFVLSSEERTFVETFSLKENEICDFEEDFQKYFLSVKNALSGHLSFDITEKTDDVTPTSGNKMLHIHSKGPNKTKWNYWSHLVFSQTYMKQTDMAKISIEELEHQKWVFCYDIMVKGIDEEQIVPSFYTKVSSNERGIALPRVQNGTWQKCEIVFGAEYPNASPASPTVVIDDAYILRIGEFHFSIPEELNEYDIYIDNVHLEKREGI